MKKFSTSFKTVFTLILTQTIIGIAFGLAILFFNSRGHIPGNVYIDGIQVGNMERRQAADVINKSYKGIIDRGAFSIKLDGYRDFKIEYRSIDAYLDSSATIQAAFGETGGQAVINFFTGHFLSFKREIAPVIKFNEGKLREKLCELSKLVDRMPVDADIYVRDGKVVKEPDAQGLKLNIDNAVLKIKKELGRSKEGKIYFDKSHNYELQTVLPKYSLKSFAQYEGVIAEYSTIIAAKNLKGSIIDAAAAINRAEIPCNDREQGNRAESFSFNRLLALKNLTKMKSDEGYNQVASTLYAAVLNAGLDAKNITRVPHKNTVDYIQPGLDAEVLGNTYDLKFDNTTKEPMMIITGVTGDALTVSIVGRKRAEPAERNKIKTEIVQVMEPAIVYYENQNMNPGEKKIISTGKKGFRVRVYREKGSNSQHESEQYLYEDEYKSVIAMVEIGPETKWWEETLK